ncbi:MAG: carboxymuconolactone decarboxylase family protein [Planctomycetaceae bacterium]|nr:carboxymuconolactone decarboxylase family protein [Planctomycetaceae bacterium]
MPIVQPVEESAAVDKAVQAFARIKEVLGVDEVPEIFRYMGNVPSFVHDFFMNFRKFVLSGGKLAEKEKMLVALAVAGQAGSQPWISYLSEFASARDITPEEITEALAVGATNSMYNVLFKFRDISGRDVFEGMPVGLRAHTFQSTSLSDQTVELINLALSDINACKPCTAAHVEKAKKEGVSDEAIYEAIQCAATMICGTQFLRSIGVN